MRGVNCPSRQRRSTRFAWPEPRIPATHTSVSTTTFTDAMIAYMQSFGNEKQRGGVALDGDHGEMQSATLLA